MELLERGAGAVSQATPVPQPPEPEGTGAPRLYPIARIQIGERHRKDLGDLRSLARSIEDIGLLHPVVITPAGHLIAGERRLLACSSLGWAEVPVHVVDLEEIVRGEHAENTIRKDFTPTESVAIADAVRDVESRRAREREIVGGRLGGQGSGNLPDPFKGQTRDKVAAYVGGSSGRTLEKATQVVRAAERDPERFGALIQRMDDTGNVHGAYVEMKRRERVEEIGRSPTGPMPTGPFQVFYADPPWRYEHAESETRAIENQYPTMSLADICALPVADRATDAAILFLWATNPKLAEALRVIESWGFTYRTNLVWVKDRVGMGYYARQRHELLLVARRGDFPAPPDDARPDSVISAPRKEHSSKPSIVYELIERMYPNAGRVELFARSERPGWFSWGNQV